MHNIVALIALTQKFGGSIQFAQKIASFFWRFSTQRQTTAKAEIWKAESTDPRWGLTMEETLA